jgi:hypothetical protein
MHAKANLFKSVIAKIQAASQHVKAVAEQFNAANRWARLVRCVSDNIAPTFGTIKPSTGI